MRLPLAVAVGVLCLTAAAPAVAAPAQGHAAAAAPRRAVAPAHRHVAAPAPHDPVGGPLLGTKGVVEQPLIGAPPLPGGMSAQSWLVADVDTGDVLAAKAAHAPHLPASTLKTLTALTLLPILDPQQTVTITNAEAGIDGTKVGLVPRMSYTVDTLFKALLVVSANDAANALADAAGGIAHTVALMNAEARHLQAYDTVARTPSGLDAPGEQTSAYDLALIARAGLQLPSFRYYIGIRRSHVPAPHHKRFEIDTHNYLLTTYPGDIGVKNGYTVAAQATYVGAATRHGHTILITMMHARPDLWHEARALLDWGFAADGKVIPVGTLVGPAQPSSQTQPTSLHARTAVSLAGHRDGGNNVPAWQLGALAVSAAVAGSVTTRRGWRRRRGRLSLPPL
jgi:D-alanyl-D-alanine carboxypeptidase (penicillin-binding protein 5/6)